MYVGDYNKEFVDFFLKLARVRRKYKKLDSIGIGINGFWIVDVRKLVKKIPEHYYLQNREIYFKILMDIVSIFILEEIIHSETGIYHNNLDYDILFYYRLIKDEVELQEIQNTNIFRYLSFLNSLINLKKFRDKKFIFRIQKEINNLNDILKRSSILEREHLAQISKNHGIEDI
ncbi:MAG: hypothetical protein ACFFCM_10925 [Promethearchaeota archaeon]